MNEKLSAARGGVYGLLSRLYRQEVDPNLLTKLQKMSFPKGCPQAELEAGYRQLEGWLATATPEALEETAADFAKVFLGAGVVNGEAAFPYESVYTSQKRLVKQEAFEQVSALYTTCGVSFSTHSSDILADHISSELSFMGWLCGQGDEGKERHFLTHHLLNWAPAFCSDVAQYATSDLYHALAKLTAGWLAMEYKYLEHMTKV